MNSKNQENFLKTMENIIVLEARLIDLKRKKQTFDREIKTSMNDIRAMIKEEKNNWACKLESPIKMEDFEKQNQIMTNIDVDNWFEEENEKEIERLENLTPEERRRERLGRIANLREAEKNNWNCK